MDIVFNIALTMILGGGALLFVIKFLKMSQQQQLNMVSEWLLLAVVQAEKELGSKTGEIKLRYVYDMFIQRFDKAAKIISFEQFNNMVDIALEKMKFMLSNNAQLAKYIGCEHGNDCECNE